MFLWLDDVRDPHIYGYFGATWAKTYLEARSYLGTGNVDFASLDHDLGACLSCTKAGSRVGDMKTPEATFCNWCRHEKTGYDLVCWMERYGVWPKDGVAVHSANPVGRAKMLQVIEKHYGRHFQWVQGI